MAMLHATWAPPVMDSLVSRWMALTAVLIVALAGCSRGLESSVSGLVTLDGQPIGPGFLVFAPAESNHNPARGAIQLDGHYALKTINTRGLPAGKYQVSVTVLDQPTVAPGERSMVAATSRIPEKYNNPQTSGLEFDVQPGGNTIDIELKSE